MATKLWHVPVRLATGAVILDQGLGKLGIDEEHAKVLHERATACEIGLGSALLAIGIVPSGLAGLGLAGFGGALTRLYLTAPGARREGSLGPSPQGIALVKDSWMLSIGLALVLDAVFGRRRRPR
jgi:hypothetical protein